MLISTPNVFTERDQDIIMIGNNSRMGPVMIKEVADLTFSSVVQAHVLSRVDPETDLPTIGGNENLAFPSPDMPVIYFSNRLGS